MVRTRILNEETRTKNTIDHLIPTSEKNKDSYYYISAEIAHSIQPKIDELKKDGEWENLVRLLAPICKRYVKEYYYLSELSRAYNQLEKYIKALTYIEQAYSIEKKDVMVLYDRGVILESNERYTEAIEMFDMILKQNIRYVAYVFPGEGMKWTKSVYNDSRYLKGVCLMKLGDYIRAKRFIKLHLTKRCSGQYSDFPKKQVLKRYNHLLKLIQESKKVK